MQFKLREQFYSRAHSIDELGVMREFLVVAQQTPLAQLSQFAHERSRWREVLFGAYLHKEAQV